MKRTAGKKLKLMLALLAAACLLTVFPALATSQGLDAAQDKKSALEAEKSKTEATLRNLESLKDDTAAYVRELDTSLEEINDELTALASDISNKEDEIDYTNERLEEAKVTEAEQYAAMKLRIKYMYERDESSYIDILLSSSTISDLLNRAEYINAISVYDREKLDEYIETKENIAAAEAELESERAELLELEEQTQAKQSSVEELLAAKQTELANYEAQIKTAEGQISSFEQDIQDQENAIRAIEAEIARQEEEARKAAEAANQSWSTVNIGDIHFIWPCPSSSRITSYFGDRESPTEGASSNHQGIDIGASTGSSIVAAADGTVVTATYSSSAGNYVMINHGGGVFTVYMHASKLLCSVGDEVKQGQTIAQVGSTGNSTGPHLHFGIRANGSYINPLAYVSP